MSESGFLALSSQLIRAEMKINSIVELLVEKEILTKEEIKTKFDEVDKRDFEKMKNELVRLVEEYEEDNDV